MTGARDDLIAALQRHGDRLRATRAAERDELDAIAELLPHAIESGISKREIARLTGVGRPWIDRSLDRL